VLYKFMKCRGVRRTFSPSIDECWYGWVGLIFNMHVRTDAGFCTWPDSLIAPRLLAWPAASADSARAREPAAEDGAEMVTR
jgi:hypothetical protein